MKKTLIAILMALLLCFAFAGCSDLNNNNDDGSKNPDNEVVGGPHDNDTTDGTEGDGDTDGDTSGSTEEDYTLGYKVTFDCDENVSILVYRTQDLSGNGEATDTAYSRNSETGDLLKDGNGQVNFKLIVANGYEIADIEIEGEYKNLKGYTYDDDSYRITKIASDLAVNVTTQAAGTDWGYEVTFNCDPAVQLTVYKTQGTTYGIVGEGETVYSRDGDLGKLLHDGEGQVNFRVVVEDGYEVIIDITDGYKNLKQDPEGEGDNTLYRITKIKKAITVTITVTKVA